MHVVFGLALSPSPPPIRTGAWLLVGVLLAALPAEAQRPFRVHDPFYRAETAERTFYDGYAFTTEAALRRPGRASTNESAAASDWLALALRLDYQLADRFDVSAIVDASGAEGGRRLALSWLALTYRRHVTGRASDYAVRLAVDPTAGARAGFPQVDAGFLYTTVMAPLVHSDFALGLRRVNLEYQRVDDEAEQLDVGGLHAMRLLTTQAQGWELHAMMRYRLQLDLAGSYAFATLSGEAARYSLSRLAAPDLGVTSTTALFDFVDDGLSPPDGGDAPSTSDPSLETPSETHRGGVIWLRAGIDFARPSYRVAPFLSWPMHQWATSSARSFRARIHVGLRFTLR